MLTISEYQSECERTIPNDVDDVENAKNFCLGLAEESGEVIGLFKKRMYHGHRLPLDKTIEELGDVLFYVGGLCSILGIELEAVMQQNIKKRYERFPNGFTSKDSIERRDVK